MKESIAKYLKNFWSPEKVIIIFLLIITWFIKELHSFYFILCRGGNERPDMIECVPQHVIEGIFSPLAFSSPVFLLFFFSLLLLPLSLLQTWFKRIASGQFQLVCSCFHWLHHHPKTFLLVYDQAQPPLIFSNL